MTRPGCPAPGCAAPVTSNGIACHDHFTAVPHYLTAAWFRNRKHDDFTSRWIRQQIEAHITTTGTPPKET